MLQGEWYTFKKTNEMALERDTMLARNAVKIQSRRSMASKMRSWNGHVHDPRMV